MSLVWNLAMLTTLVFALTGMSQLDESLIKAVRQGDAQQVEVLIKRGANVKVYGDTPLREAVIHGHTTVAEVLLKFGANVEAQDKDGETPLHSAALHNKAEVAEVLLKHGARTEARDKYGDTPLFFAAHQGSAAVVEVLLKRGAVVNASDEKLGWTPLHWAAWKGDSAVVRLLLDHGADVGLKDRNSETPLHKAVIGFGGHPEIVQLLLERDAYVGVKDKHGSTPLDYARVRGKASIVRLLEEAEAAQTASAKTSPPPSKIPSLPNLPIPSSVPSSDVDRIPSKTANPKPNAYAVVIGIEQYRQGLSKADFAVRDAQVMRDYLTKIMGYAEENVAVLLNDRAAKTDIEKYIEHWLPNHVEQDTSVFVYFSGHGAPNPKTSDAYLVPYDGDPAFVEATGYPLKRLYEHLAKLPAKEVVVMLDSCFSGAGGRSVIAKGTRPMALSVENPVLAGGKTVVLAASSGGQVSSTYLQQGHGLLTYFFLKGLRGEADTNKDGAIDLAEIFSYVKPQVERTARRGFNNEQTPQLLGAPDLLARGIRLVEVGP
jgi:ankyrin repeat protein